MSDISAIDTTGKPALLLQQIQKLQPPKAPTLAPVPAAPVAQITNPLKAMSPGLMLLATLGGALTRAPITTALNNATGFINGVKAGNQYITKTRLDNFNAAIKQATAANATATDQYKLAMSQYGNDAAKLQQDLLGIASEHGDDPVKALLESGDIKDAVNLIESREKTASDMQVKLAQLNEAAQFHSASLALANANLKIKQQQLKDQEQNTLTPDAVQIGAETYLATGQLPYLGMGAAGGGRQAIMNAAAELAKKNNITPQDILAGRVEYKATQSSLNNLQKQSDAAQSYLQTMDRNIQILQGLLNKGAGTSAGPVINRWLQAGRSATGDPDVRAFNTAMNTVMDEYAKIISGSVGTQGASVTALNQTNNMLRSFDSPQAITETINRVILPESHNRIVSYNRQIAAIQQRIRTLNTASPAAVTPNPEATHANVIRYDANGNRIP